MKIQPKGTLPTPYFNGQCASIPSGKAPNGKETWRLATKEDEDEKEEEEKDDVQNETKMGSSELN